MRFIERLWIRRSVPARLAQELANVFSDAWAFGGRFTIHNQLGLPVRFPDRTEAQRRFDHEYVALLLSWIGLAVDTIDFDLKFGNGPSSDRYAEAVEEVYETLVQRIQGICGGEPVSFLRGAFERYSPPVEQVAIGCQLIDYQLQAFVDNLEGWGLEFDPELAKSWLGGQCIRVQPRIDSLVETYVAAFTTHCCSSQ